MALHFVPDLPKDPIDAATRFHASVLPAILAELADPDHREPSILIVFPDAPHDHRAWRLAAIQDLARRAAPIRINGVVRAGGADVTEASHFFATAPGITGQLLAIEPR